MLGKATGARLINQLSAGAYADMDTILAEGKTILETGAAFFFLIKRTEVAAMGHSGLFFVTDLFITLWTHRQEVEGVGFGN